ncbi:MAG: hypothetical protein K0Q59_1349 [Paenibacillus sp.]|jgi:hypothetical protein|nr:hypothetical protein [Paenibacillus sp.]
MAKRCTALVAVGLCYLLLVIGCGENAYAAQPNAEAMRQLLEKGLSLYELDREIDRLSDEESKLNAVLAETDTRMRLASEQLENQQRKAEKVIRAYYTGDRASLLLAALRVHSIKDALYVWDQLQSIIANDRKAIADYMSQSQSYKSQKLKLEHSVAQLAATRAAFAAEKEKRQQTQQDVDRLLAANPERAQAVKQIEDTRKLWEDRGLPLFDRYFSALSETMTKLPELFGQNYKMVSIKGLSPKLTIGDQELNRFMQQKSSQLSGFSFLFNDGSITAGGKSDDLSISLIGRYVVEQKPVNAIRFAIDNLTFNGYEMPASTAKALEREYDLAFYPSDLAPFVQATDVRIEQGAMTISLKLSL